MQKYLQHILSGRFGFLVLVLTVSLNGFAQKNIRLNVTQLRLNGLSTGCDGIGSEEPRWYFTNNQNGNDWCSEESSGSSGNQTWTKDNDVFNQSYICPSDIPANVSLRMRSCENDGTSCWTLSSCDGGEHDHSEAISTTITNGTYTSGYNLGAKYYTDNHGGCGDADYGYTVRMIVSGSWATNQDANGNTTNAACNTAIDMTSGIGTMPTNDGWRGPVRTHVKKCATYLYYKFNLTSNVSYFEIDMFNSDGDVEVYYMNADETCGCAVTNDAGTFDYDFKKNNPSLGWYVVRLRNGGDYADVDFRTGSGITRPSNDNFCNAANLSSSFNYNSTPLSNTVNTDNASTEDICTTDEPSYGNEKTVWWKFTTGTNPPAQIIINPSASGLCTGQARVYSGAASGTCSGGIFTSYSSGNSFSGLSQIDYTDFGNNFYINCPAASTTYYILGKVGGVCSSGSLTITVTSNGAPRFNNDICVNATDLGTLNAGSTIGNASGSSRYNNFCATATSDPNPGWGTGAPFQPVWFKFTTAAGSGRDVDFEAYNDPASLGDQINLRMALYEGCGGTKIFAEGTQPAYSESVNTKCLKPSTTYYLMVDGVDLVGGGEGFFGLTVKDNGPYPSNDLICGATTIANQTIYTYNSTTLGTESNVKGTNCFEPNPDWTFETGQDNDHGIWYYLGQVPGRTVIVDANSSGADNIDLQFALYSSTTPKGSCVTPASSPSLTEIQKEYAGAGVAWDEDAYFNCLDPAKYYWLMVDGSAGSTSLITSLEEGIFSIRFWNPEEGETTWCNAENIGIVPTSGSITKLNLANKCGAASGTFGTSGSVTIPSGFTLDAAVVYKFTTPASGSIEVTATSNPYYAGQMGLLSGDEVDLQLAVFEQSGGTCSTANFFPKGNNYDATDGFNENLIVNCLLPNTVYYLMVDGSGLNTSGYFDITISDYGKATPNDFLCNAIDITPTNSAPWTSCNSNSVVQELGENNYCGTSNNDIPSSLGIRPPAWSEINGPVWYKFKAPKSGKLKIEAINSVTDALPPYDEPEISAQLAVFFLPGGYQGTCTNLSTEKERLQYIGSNHDGLLHDEEYTIECLMADSIYYLLVDGSSETLCPTCTRGEFYLKLTADPRDRSSQNDLICNAVDLGTPILSTTIVDTKVSPASGAATNPSPLTGYPSATGLHNAARNNANSCMRVENNFCAGIIGEPAVSGGTFLTDFSPDATVWYSFTAPATGEVIIDAYNDPDSRGDQIDLQLAVFESSDGTCGGTLVPIKAEYNAGSFDETMRVQCLNPGQKYWLMVDGSGLNTYGYFEVQVQAVTATLSGPANDDICNATSVAYPGSIGATTTVNNQTNRCATIQTIYSEPTTFTKDADVWYKFTTPNTAAPHAVEVTVTSGLPWPFGDAMDPQIALYKMNPSTGPCATSFTLVDDGYSAAGVPFYETFEFHCLEQNTTYYLMVDGSGINEQGNFKLDVKRIAPHPLATNDNICNVTNLATGSLGTLGATTGNTVGNTSTNWHNFCSSVEVGEPALMTDGNYTLDQTVWFKFRTPNTVNNIDVEIRGLNDPNNVGDQIDLQMLLVQGNPGCTPTNFTSLTPIESVDPPLTFNATLNVCLPPNTDFYINVDGSGLNKQGYFTIEIENKGLTSAPSNDNICNAKTLPNTGTITNAYTGYLNDNNNCATLENFEKQQTAGSIQRSVWYKFVAPSSADVSITVKGNSLIPFTTNYFLPDVTIWELNDGIFASPATTIAGCAAPTAAQWNKLEYNDYQGIPNSLASGLYPTVVLTPLCLKPNYTYYVQVDGSAGVGLDGYFDITIKNNQVPYTQPVNNEASAAITVPLSSASCQLSNGTWQSTSGYSFGTNPTWSNPSLIGIASASALPSCTQNCGDVWYKFQMPLACGNNTKSFVKIEGDDEFNVDINGYPELAIAAYNGGSTTFTSNLSYMKCSVGGSSADPDFSIAANPGDWIYLQIWDLDGNEQGKTFKLCVSEQKSADACADATNMTLDIPYCWSVESHGGETPSSAVPGSGLNTCFGSGNPQHSTYFSFTTDAATNFCDDYYIYINTAALAKALPSGANHACLAGINSSVSLNMALWELKTTGTACTPGIANVVQEDCITWNDCGGGSFGANVSGPHGNGGLIQDTIYYNLSTGQELKPNTTYYIVLDYNIDNVLYESRVVLDGTITVGRRCKGRTWEYTTAPTVTTDQYCVARDGWRHYYDDKGTTATGDDKYVFSLYPNGNNFEGTATITLDPTFHRFEDFPNHFAEYVMRRRWDFQVTSGSISASNPVKVRFYYQNAEKQEIITAAQTFAVMYPSNYEDFEWFKSANGHVFNPYTDVNPKVISVGPNGYSETGCLSYWNDAGVYVGPPGVTRCITKVITDWDDNNTYHQSCNGIHFAEYNGLTGFSGGTGGTGDSPYDVSPLPVELVSFTGYNDGAVNGLNWVTASERNTLKFEVERKTTSGNGFAYIGEKAAFGNSTTIQNYTLNDEYPAIGDNYYRLKAIDTDGSYEYSQTILINNKDKSDYKDAISNIYPNPVNHLLYIDYQSSSNKNIILKVFDALGKEMLMNKLITVKGNQQFRLDVAGFASGIYIIHIQDEINGKIIQTKFVKE